MTIESSTQILIGILLLSLVTVESGGALLLRIGRGAVPVNDLQRSFFRAGHAHAAVLLILGIAICAVIDTAEVGGTWSWIARTGVPIAALLMPAGFFLSVLGDDPPKPNRLVALIGVGAGALTIGLIAAGLAMVLTGTGTLD